MKIERLLSAIVLVLLLAIPGLSQERELVQKMEKLERSLVELTQQRNQLNQKLEIAADKNQEGNVKELRAAIEGNASRKKELNNWLAELRVAMRQRAERAERGERAGQERERSERRERASQERERSERGARERAEQSRQRAQENRERAEHNRERGEQDRERGERARSERRDGEPELHPEIQKAIQHLEHMKQAMGHLREANMDDIAEKVEQHMKELGGKIKKSMARSRQAREENQREKNRKTEREERQNRESATFTRRRTEGHETARRMDGMAEELSGAIRQLRNEVRELRNQMEQMKKERHR